jgi:hypothetical protein
MKKLGLKENQKLDGKGTGIYSIRPAALPPQTDGYKCDLCGYVHRSPDVVHLCNDGIYRCKVCRQKLAFDESGEDELGFYDEND